MTVAIVADHLVQRGGAERVTLSMTRAFPNASLHTSLFEPSATHPAFETVHVRTSPLDRIAAARRHHRMVAPLLAPTFGRMRFDQDLVVCSTAGWSHGVQATGAKLAYFHSPARWLHDTDGFLGASSRAVRLAASLSRRPLLRWDNGAVPTIDGFLANSRTTATRLRDAYGVEAPVVLPPVLVDPTGDRSPIDGIEPGFALVVSRLIAYKHVDSVVAAFADRPGDRLVVVGDGPDRTRIEDMAGTNVTLCGHVDEPTLRWLYGNARLLISAAHEDFGLTPIEANAFGCPVAVRGAGGHLDTVEPGTSGVFFEGDSVGAIGDGIDEADRVPWSPDALRAHARRFDEAGFAAALRSAAADLVGRSALGPEPVLGVPLGSGALR